jgi:hypothetical protein
VGSFGDIDVDGDGSAEVEDAHHEQEKQPGEKGELHHRLASRFVPAHQ